MSSVHFSPVQYPIEYFGTPDERRKSRRIISYVASETAAYKPSILESVPKIDMALFEKLTPDIENHFERKLQLYLLQLLAVYKTDLVLGDKKVDLQIGQGKNGKRKKDSYAACHAGTTPSLVCKKKKEKMEVVFGQGTILNDISNETTFLPLEVNRVDSRLDLHHRKLECEIALRGKAVWILNLVAKKDSKVDPRIGLGAFISYACQLMATAKKVDDQIERHLILDCYSRVAKIYEKEVIFKDNGLKMLCRRLRWQEDIGHDFYRNVQQEIFASYFKIGENPIEMGMLSQLPVNVPKQIVVEEKKEEALPKLSGLTLDYQLLLERSEKINGLIKKYFAEMPENIIAKDRLSFKKLKTSVTAKKSVDWSESMWEIYRESLKLIRASYPVIEPQKMSEILTRVVRQS